MYITERMTSQQEEGVEVVVTGQGHRIVVIAREGGADLAAPTVVVGGGTVTEETGTDVTGTAVDHEIETDATGMNVTLLKVGNDTEM